GWQNPLRLVANGAFLRASVSAAQIALADTRGRRLRPTCSSARSLTPTPASTLSGSSWLRSSVVHVSGTATLTPLAGPPNRLKPGGSGGSAPSRAEPLPEQAVPVTRHSVSRVAVSAKRRTRTGLPSSWNGAALSPRAPC